MKKSVKRGIAIAAVVLVVLIAIPAGLIASAFIGNRPLEAKAFGTDAVIKDGFVAVGPIKAGNKIAQAFLIPGHTQGRIAYLAARLGQGHAEVKAIICAHSGALETVQPLLDFKG